MNRRRFLKKSLIIFPFLILRNFSFHLVKQKNIFLKKFKKHIWILSKNDF